ncbi:MAG: outer membrane beta-barrel protein [Bacteroidales bacterium]|nr:outer membrane beta-barrel protein [Bacteroidales bacterium]
MKKNLTFSKLLMLVIVAMLPMSMMAQEGKKHSKPAEKYWYIQADGGLSINHGDLANYTGGVWGDFDHFKVLAKNFTQNWNAHLGIGYQFGKVVGMNLKGGYGLLSGHKHGQALVMNSNADNTLWNLGFDKTNYIEGNLNLTFNLFNMFNYNPRRVINFVPHIGVGGLYYQAGVVNQLAGVDNGEGTVVSELAPAKTERELTFTVPAGMEITFNLAPKFDIFLDYTYLFTGSDNLDQVAKIASDEAKHVINDKDMYSQLNLGLRYKFNNPCDIEKMARESKRITYRVEPNPLVKGEDGNVCFDVIVTIPGEYFEKQAVMNLKPYLAYNGGQIDLDPITFVGEKVKGEGDFRVNYKEGGEFTKHYCKPYQEEMANCELMGDPMFYVYNGTIYPTQDEIVKNTYFTQGSTVKLADGVVVKDEYIDQTVYDTIDKVKAVKKLTYFFNKDKYNIADRKKLNKEADAAFLDLLNAGETEFEIRAWASPEGEEGHNNELSNNRDNAAEKQMLKLAKKTEITINGKGYGEDWETFKQLVKDSNLKDKDAILNNINNSSNPQRTIKEMCAIYPQLEKDILPQIRRAEVYVNEPYKEVVSRVIKVKVEKN